jgi:hypothetical protein
MHQSPYPNAWFFFYTISMGMKGVRGNDLIKGIVLWTRNISRMKTWDLYKVTTMLLSENLFYSLGIVFGGG